MKLEIRTCQEKNLNSIGITHTIVVIHDDGKTMKHLLYGTNKEVIQMMAGDPRILPRYSIQFQDTWVPLGVLYMTKTILSERAIKGMTLKLRQEGIDNEKLREISLSGDFHIVQGHYLVKALMNLGKTEVLFNKAMQGLAVR